MTWNRSKLVFIVAFGLLSGCMSPSDELGQDKNGFLNYRVNKNLPALLEDDPSTTNDESNDQPVGYYGNETIKACTTHNDRCYSLDADIEKNRIERIYFPKGGYVDFLDGSYDGRKGWGKDENDRLWEFEKI